MLNAAPEASPLLQKLISTIDGINNCAIVPPHMPIVLPMIPKNRRPNSCQSLITASKKSPSKESISTAIKTVNL